MRDHGLDTYLSGINEVPLLTPDQEIELATKIQRGDLAANAAFRLGAHLARSVDGEHEVAISDLTGDDWQHLIPRGARDHDASPTHCSGFL